MTDKWSKDDLPETLQVFQLGNYRTAYFDAQVRDALAKHLNTHHPKPKVGVEINYHWRNPDAIDVIEKLTRERDAAVERADESEQKAQRYSDKFNRARSFNVEMKARAEKAERERDEAVRRVEKVEAERDDWMRRSTAHAEDAETAERERDQAREQWKKWEHKANEWKARAEAAEKRHTWPKTTPTGHTYIAPDTYAALCHQHGNAAQAAIESWEADECPPEPTWEMVGIAHREVERLQRERDEMRPSYDEAVSMAYWAAKRLGCHVDDLDDLTLTEMAERVAAQPAPAIARTDIEKAILPHILYPANGTQDLIDDVHALVSGDDPAVYVVRESDLPAARVDGDYYVVASAKGDYRWPQHGPSWWAGRAQDALAKAARYTALARLAADREAAANPVEAKAEELWEATREGGAPVAAWADAHEDAQAQFRVLARHVLGQEADQ